MSMSRLGKLWMFESPSIFWALWKAVSPFVDSATKKKIEFVSGAKAVDEITAEIDLEASSILRGALLSLSIANHEPASPYMPYYDEGAF